MASGLPPRVRDSVGIARHPAAVVSINEHRAALCARADGYGSNYQGTDLRDCSIPDYERRVCTRLGSQDCTLLRRLVRSRRGSRNRGGCGHEQCHQRGRPDCTKASGNHTIEHVCTRYKSTYLLIMLLTDARSPPATASAQRREEGLPNGYGIRGSQRRFPRVGGDS